MKENKIPVTKVNDWLHYCEIDATDEQVEVLTEIINQWCIRVPVGADGEPILVGDTVYNVKTGEPRKIASYGGLYAYDEDNLFCDTKWYTHVFPDSWEKLEADAELDGCGYFGECPKCAEFDFELCQKAITKDILRRAKRLAGVKDE